MTDATKPPQDFIKPTTDFWQELLAADDPRALAEPPYRFGYPAELRDGRKLLLPLRALPEGDTATASLIANHASFQVLSELSADMSELARAANVDQVVGMPTLGLSFAPTIAERLGLSNYVPLGYSRKYWYREDLSHPVHSITTPSSGKRVYIDPNIVPRLTGRRVAVVDDAVSSGSTLASVLQLLGRLDCEVAVIVVAMVQGARWKAALEAIDPAAPGRLRGAFASPLFERTKGGWTPIPGTFHPL
jgi:adenine/guanine phosphoribosyltransferase-like PRPP-binding protein